MRYPHLTKSQKCIHYRENQKEKKTINNNDFQETNGLKVFTNEIKTILGSLRISMLCSKTIR